MGDEKMEKNIEREERLLCIYVKCNRLCGDQVGNRDGDYDIGRK